MRSQLSGKMFVLAAGVIAVTLLLLSGQTASSSGMMRECSNLEAGTGALAPSAHNFEVYNDPSWSGGWCYSDTPMSANIASSCNNKTSSVKLVGGWSVRLYNGQNQSGSSICFNRSDGNLNNNTYSNNSAMDNTISSFTLYHEMWCGGSPSPAYPLEVYNDASYSGSWCYSEKTMTANIASSCNDKVTSILLRPGWSIRVYRDTNQNGPSQCLNGSDSNLSNNTYDNGSAMNNTISSFVLYDEADCGGETPTPTPTNTPIPPPTVPYFSQIDPSWKNHPLRGSCSCKTIGRCGCTLTSAAMIFKYYGVDLTPASLSDCMGNKACPFYWWVAGSSCSNGEAQYEGKKDFSWSQLEYQLNHNNRPVILRLHRKHDHFVLVLSGSGSNPANYTIHDPGVIQGANMRLDAYTSKSWKLKNLYLYGGQPASNIVIAENSISISKALDFADAIQKVPPQSLVSVLETRQLSASSVVTGSVETYRMTAVTMTVQLTADSTAGNITEMLIWTDSMSSTTWLPYTTLVELPASEEIYVRFKDESQNISPSAFGTLFTQSGPSSFDVFLPMILKR
ncbi:MAG: hypothetical protein DRJ03_10755 [Chloroflexi bacterium]|nr:MAG: hypothetical protein DRI81_07720 [Chloroflexota bacterium]RLC85734.1 MAG: hypothetical protein DRJ03_10755 [Chloroflexota bacterium]